MVPLTGTIVGYNKLFLAFFLAAIHFWCVSPFKFSRLNNFTSRGDASKYSHTVKAVTLIGAAV
jgi:HAMP domain-containing protein